MWCLDCIGDDFLERELSSKTNNSGNCELCKNTKKLNSIEELSKRFEPLIGLYEKDDTSENTLIDLLQKDWNLFPKLEINDFESSENYMDIDFAARYTSAYKEDPTEKNNWRWNKSKWAEFKRSIKEENRFFPTPYEKLNDQLEVVLKELEISQEELPGEFFRARLNSADNKDTPYSMDKIGAPPIGKSSSGRANPLGIPYLYLASCPETAIAEIRPHKGDAVTLGTFKLKKPTEEPINLIDLTNTKKRISPFKGYIDGELEVIYLSLQLLEALEDELSLPVARDQVNLAYLASQYLCEFIKHNGYHGVIYQSSVWKGKNYAIFEPEKFDCISTCLHTIDEVKFTSIPPFQSF